MTFESPQLTEEESESFFLSKSLKCDGCIAATWKIHEQFKKGHAGRKSPDFVLKEHQVLDLIEIGCSDFGSYGITSREGANRIKGPGLWDSGVPGVSHIGGKLPRQLRE